MILLVLCYQPISFTNFYYYLLLEDDDKSYGNQALRIQDYLIEIRRTCNQRDKAELYERDLIRKIISEWNEIRKLRDIQRFNNTSVKLTVKKQEVGLCNAFSCLN